MRSKDRRVFSHVIIWTTLLFFVIAVIWANYAELDEITKGEGTVIPSSQIQVIQNLEGGILEKIFVSEGEIVEKGQVLMQIDNTRFRASYNEAFKKINALKVRKLRLDAERKKIDFVIPAEIKDVNPIVAEAEEALFNARKNELNQLQQGLSLAKQELNLTIPLVRKGAASEVEVLKLRRTVNELEGKLYQFRSKALEQLNEVNAELAALSESYIADKDRLQRTTVRSPVKGIVNQLKITTLGGVIKPGMDILEIVPLNDTLLIEAKIKPSDIGFLVPKQKAVVKITAYEFTIYGGLDGYLEQISADTITEDVEGKEETFYLVRVRTDKNHFGSVDKPLYIIPGMKASVDIITGKKTVLEYIMKPILRAKANALTER